VTFDTTTIAFAQFSGAGQISAGDGLAKDGNTLSVDYGAAGQMVASGVAAANAAGSSTKVSRADHVHAINWTRQDHPAIAAVGADTAQTAASAQPIDADGFMLYLNGVMAIPGAGKDYTLSGTTVTWLASSGSGEDLSTDDILTYIYV
jgi:hypothetical protein